MPLQSPPSSQPPLIRVERKYVVASGAEEFALAWLRVGMLPDPAYPANRVHTIYFDTPDLDAYDESVEGDVIKQKVRLRWYDGPPERTSTAVFIEMKAKDGWTTVKQRQLVETPSSALKSGAAAEVVDPAEMCRTLTAWGYHRPLLLRPILFNIYTRYRFFDPLTRMRLNLDSHITSAFLSDGALQAPSATLPATILELKSERLLFPARIEGVRRYLSPWTAFSKYAACLELHLARTAPLVWPSPGYGPREFQVRKVEESYGMARNTPTPAF